MLKLKAWPLWSVTAFLLFAGLFAFWLKNASRWPIYRQLTREGKATTGWVTAKGLNGQRRVNYSFAADGRVYSGLGRAGFGTPEFNQLNPGDEVLIFYLPRTPEVSELGDPKEHLRQQNRVLAFAFTFIGIAAFLVIRREIRRGSGEDEFGARQMW